VWFTFLYGFGAAVCAQSSQQNVPTPQQVPDADNIPEEDDELAPEKFVLNPLESERNLKIGNYYFGKKDYRGALGRYERAVRFNPNSADAYFKVGETEEKLNHPDRAQLAFKKVVQMAPDSKLGKQAKKKLASNKS
jgi:tetratricopeptide (TPR) repeat protein